MQRRAIPHRAGRRNFFKKAAILGGTAVLTVLGKRAMPENSSDLPEKSSAQGYRLTAHIRKYYKKASL